MTGGRAENEASLRDNLCEILRFQVKKIPLEKEMLVDKNSRFLSARIFSKNPSSCFSLRFLYSKRGFMYFSILFLPPSLSVIYSSCFFSPSPLASIFCL